VGAWPIGVSGLITLYVAILAYSKKSDITITRLDWLFLSIALCSLPVWYFTSDPLWAVILLTGIDVLGFGPTIRKAYSNPRGESRLFYSLFVVRNGLVLMSLEHLSLTTVLFPLVTGLACIVLLAVILFRSSREIEN